MPTLKFIVFLILIICVFGVESNQVFAGKKTTLLKVPFPSGFDSINPNLPDRPSYDGTVIGGLVSATRTANHGGKSYVEDGEFAIRWEFKDGSLHSRTLGHACVPSEKSGNKISITSTVDSISADGKQFIGVTCSMPDGFYDPGTGIQPYQFFRWNEESGFQTIESYYKDVEKTWGTGLVNASTYNGSKFILNVRNLKLTKSDQVILDESNHYERIDAFPGSEQDLISGMSFDGKIFSGNIHKPKHTAPFYWQPGRAPVFLRDELFYEIDAAIVLTRGGDWHVLVVNDREKGEVRLARWKPGLHEVQYLGELPKGQNKMEFWSASADGSVIIGRERFKDGTKVWGELIVWQENLGLSTAKDYLSKRYGINDFRDKVLNFYGTVSGGGKTFLFHSGGRSDWWYVRE